MVIPGLPDDIALQCLIRLPKFSLLRIRCVSKAWNELVSSKQFYLLRQRHLLVDDWLVLVVPRNSRLYKSARLLAYDFNSAASHRIKGPMEAEKHLDLMGVGCASQGHRLFVLGGSSASHDGIEFQNHSGVTIFDAATSSWTTGSRMKIARSYFACCFIEGTLYVAGGCDNEQSTEAYDSELDKWTLLESMPFGFNHIESFAVFQSKLYVKGRAGRNRRVLVFDPRSSSSSSSSDTGRWKLSRGLEGNLREGEFVATGDHLYVINQAGYVGRLDDDKEHGWKEVGIVSRYFLPFAASSPSSLSSLDLVSNSSSAVLFRNDAFFVTSKGGEDVTDLKNSRQLYRALLLTFYHCQGAVLHF
ncbi:F-box/kelch-repeat protein At1g16250-like [Selaginella moellendorffii]|uniref:F-box/kelch-repeat protein At1g16250-like n=1 Tax=Selaginella moellendorffii TaxID=88036 RepID=UPI000D1C97C8|nr:F-box/kelch-repeat protein At1g16250-like [Selaginella moellendorffii]|eukprot:XP_024532747.1 F-box/kelch-repeat protein At1g16250-like [Selaginella moellendorffii]